MRKGVGRVLAHLFLGKNERANGRNVPTGKGKDLSCAVAETAGIVRSKKLNSCFLRIFHVRKLSDHFSFL